MNPAPDQKARDEILAERDRNVVVDAGAGTGKTETIVGRFVALLEAHPIERMAAITFTRRAAGELKYRIREKILTRLGSANLEEGAKKALRYALAGLDGAYIGTIHSFADRLLKLRPAEAGLSPSYEIEEDTSELENLAVERLFLAAERGTCNVLREALDAGLPLRTVDRGFQTDHGLDSLIGGMIEKRDVDLRLPAVPEPDLQAIGAMAKEASKEIRALKGTTPGVQAMADSVQDFDRIAAAKDSLSLVRHTLRLDRFFPWKLQKKVDFQNDGIAWGLYKRLMETDIPGILQPLKDWMAARLAGLVPHATGAYDAIKREREVVDQTDLLLKLRTVLRQEPHRRFLAGLFDHVFVDEFQDTDPIQANILELLIKAEGVDKPLPGRITIVGDAKQSIYRFRRADIEAYSRFRGWLKSNGALVQSLQANFRSTSRLIEFFNDRFVAMMGPVKDNVVFDPTSGRVFYETLQPTHSSTMPGVHLIPLVGAGGGALGAGDGRPIEAAAFATYLSYLKGSGFEVRRNAGPTSPMTWGDVAVLSLSTTHWPGLFDAFHRLGIPFAARGGSVFARNPHVQALILALRAVSDSHDGVALAAYYRVPFWPLSLDEIVAREEAYRRAEDVLLAVRRDRSNRPPAESARALLERTRAAATLEGGSNGGQAVALAEELIQVIDGLAREGLDFDAITRELRGWIDDAPKHDAPEPVAEDVVRFLTIHQAKGLEFPVVVLADAFQLNAHELRDTWIVHSQGTEASVRLKDLEADVPPGCGLMVRERRFGDAELERLAYVGATRARDLLVLSKPTYKKDMGYLHEPLMEERAGLTLRVDPYRPDQLPSWAVGTRPVAPFRASPAIEETWRAAWQKGLAQAARRIASPTPVTRLASTFAETEEARHHVRLQKGVGRYGPIFGSTVHRTLQLLLSGAKGTPREVVERAAVEYDLTDRFVEATADVERALETLSKIAGDRFPEFPVSQLLPDGHLLEGFADVVCVGEEVWVVDFKTDTPPIVMTPDTLPQYAEQLRLYARCLQEARTFDNRRPVRLGLLFTATGALHEVPHPASEPKPARS